MDKMEIRKATKKDIKIISKIFREGYSEEPYNENWSEKIANERMKNDLKTEEIFVLEDNNQIIGFVTLTSYLWHTGLRGFIHEIVIGEEFRGKGYGKKLMEFAELRFKEIGAKEIQLITSPKSKAYQIYKKLNYIDEGFITMYKVI